MPANELLLFPSVLCCLSLLCQFMKNNENQRHSFAKTYQEYANVNQMKLADIISPEICNSERGSAVHLSLDNNVTSKSACFVPSLS